MAAIQSMTAFARREGTFTWGALTWEIRSVNHRYLEVQMRLPETAQRIEMQARELLRERVGRGKVDCSLRLRTSAVARGPLTIDETVLLRLHEALTRTGELLGPLATPSALEVLRWPGVIAEQHPDEDEMAHDALGLLGKAIDELIAMRTREGATLANQIEQRLVRIDTAVDEIRNELPTILAAHRQRLQERVSELDRTIDAQRLEQEIVLLAARSDVAEELDRLQSHVREARHSLVTGGSCGRRLDFLMQEFNREANTLASKSLSALTTRTALELKVLIEQIREQVQNIE